VKILGQFSGSKPFGEHVRPWIERWPADRREQLKLSLAHFLDKPEVLEYKALAQVQDFTMREPSDIQCWFRWLYEVLFPEQDITEVDLSDVVEDNDVMKTNFQSS